MENGREAGPARPEAAGRIAAPARERTGSEVAIIGLAGRFPGAEDLEELFENLRGGVESIARFDEEALRAAGVPAEQRAHPAYVPARPVLRDADCFDAELFGYTPREAALLDPQHRLFLEQAWAALEDAGYDPLGGGRVGVFGGAGENGYLLHNVLSNPALVQSLGGLEILIDASKDFLCTRTSYALDLRGPSLTVQTACSTSLVAVHLACQSLLNGECDVALAGAASVRVPLSAGYLFQEGGIWSPDGHCRPFDVRGAGTIFGSGVAVVVLKPLEQALADGDAIRAVILGSAINNDGRAKVGYTAPAVDGQADVIAEALAVARVEPDSIGYVEAHGTATPLGDTVEMAALTQAWRERTAARGICAVGSVKSNIGHLDVAAGMAGLAKAVLALQRREIPPTLHFEAPNPALDLASTPFYVNARLEPWPARGGPRRAAVSSFGVGGTNAHLVLEEAPPPPPTRGAGPRLLLLSARSEPALARAARRLAAHLRRHPELSLADVEFTLRTGRHPFKQRAALVCGSVAAAARALEALAEEPELSGRIAGAGRDGAGAAEIDPALAVRAAALESAGRRWVAGAAVDPEVWGAPEGRRVSLPPYAFERTRCWIEPPAAAPAGAEAGKNAGASAGGAAREQEPAQLTRGEIEAAIVLIWKELLGVDEVLADDDFFELGGSSLLAVRMLGRLRERTGVKLLPKDLFAAPTAEALAGVVTARRAGAAEGAEAPVQLIETLPAEIAAAGAAAWDRRPPRAVLLTGATGFLGRHLLAELLRATDARVHCLVRAAGPGEARQRLREALGPAAAAAEARVVAVAGDLAAPLLGLGPDGFAALADEIGAVYHNGSWVNWIYPYPVLQPANVLGTVEVLRLAAAGRPKPVHYVSSVGVFDSHAYAVDERCPEGPARADLASFTTGYALTKWNSELLVDQARERGLPVFVYRPSYVVGDSRTGACNTNDFLLRMVKGCVQLGAVPELHVIANMAPVDYVARALVRLSQDPGEAGSIYHLTNPLDTGWMDVVAWLRRRGYRLRVLPYREWQVELAAASEQDNALAPLKTMFPDMDAPAPREDGLPHGRRFDCALASGRLAGSGIECPPVGDGQLDVYGDYLVASGFLPAP